MPSLSFQIIIHVCFFFLGQFSQPTPRAGSPVPVPHQGPLPNPPLAAGRRLSTTPQSNQSASLGPLWWGTPRRPSQKEKGKLASAQGLAKGRRLSHALSSSCQWLGQMSHTVLNLVAWSGSSPCFWQGHFVKWLNCVYGFFKHKYKFMNWNIFLFQFIELILLIDTQIIAPWPVGEAWLLRASDSGHGPDPLCSLAWKAIPGTSSRFLTQTWEQPLTEMVEICRDHSLDVRGLVLGPWRQTRTFSFWEETAAVDTDTTQLQSSMVHWTVLVTHAHLLQQPGLLMVRTWSLTRHLPQHRELRYQLQHYCQQHGH